MVPNILVVASEQDFRDSIKGIFEFENYNVIEDTDGRICLGLINNSPPAIDLILLYTFQKPDATYVGVLNKLIQAENAIPVIVVSHVHRQYNSRIMEMGAMDIFNMGSIDVEELLVAIKYAIQSRRRRGMS